MDDNALGTMMLTEWKLGLFLDAYEAPTGQRLEVRGSGERPDFLCARRNGHVVGVDFIKVVRGPEPGTSDQIMWARPSHTTLQIA